MSVYQVRRRKRPRFTTVIFMQTTIFNTQEILSNASIKASETQFRVGEMGPFIFRGPLFRHQGKQPRKGGKREREGEPPSADGCRTLLMMKLVFLFFSASEFIASH